MLMLRWNVKSYLYLLVILLVLSSVVIAQDFYLCTRVVDGDTIVVEIEGKQEKVRLIGVDTPETVHPSKPVEYFGKEASVFTRSMVERKKVTLDYDWQKRDKYGRLLAYVYLEDGKFLNAEIIKQGYGFAYTKYPFKYLEEFRQYEKDARNNSRGLWKKPQSVNNTDGYH
jgi:micrococcal nuclease